MHSAEEILACFSLPSKVRPIAPSTRFGMLTVLGMAMPIVRANGRLCATSLCRCDCGSERSYRNNGLRSGYWQSCGCKQKEHAAEGLVTHGHARGGRRSSELTAHRMMIRRCTDQKCKDWPDYGGRGIRVCEAWRESFEAFLRDMGLKPSPMHSIERRDVDGDYCPSNCFWASPIQQANNKRNTFRVEYKGRSLSLAELARATELPSGALRRRLLDGMNAEEAVRSTQHRKRLPSRRKSA